MARYVLGLDLGTSSAHCLLADCQGRPVADGDAPIEYHCPDGGPLLAREFHPGKVLATVGRLVRKTCRQAGAEAREIKALGITSQGQGMVLLGRGGHELYCGPNIDLRAVLEGAAIDDEAAPEIYRTTGHFPSLLLAPARLQWFRKHRPTVLESAGAILSIAGWLVYRLTGQVCGGQGLHCGLGLLDLATRESPVQLLKKLGFPIGLVPHVAGVGEPVGTMRAELAEDWGLPNDIPVTLAEADSRCGLLGMGLACPGQVGALLGWSGSVQMLTSTPKLDADHQRTWAGCYPIGGLFTVEANLGDVGNAYAWLVRTVGGGNLSYQEAECLAENASPGCDGVLSYLGPGPLSAPRAGLRLGGIVMPTPFAFQETTPAQIFRSYLESLAYAVKSNLETVSEIAGPDASVLYLGGRLARSGVLASTLANLLAIPVYRSQQGQVSALGAATAAWVAAGKFSCLEEAVAAARPDFDVFLPEPVGSAECQGHYQRWVELYHRLSPPA